MYLKKCSLVLLYVIVKKIYMFFLFYGITVNFQSVVCVVPVGLSVCLFVCLTEANCVAFPKEGVCGRWILLLAFPGDIIIF